MKVPGLDSHKVISALVAVLSAGATIGFIVFVRREDSLKSFADITALVGALAFLFGIIAVTVDVMVKKRQWARIQTLEQKADAEPEKVKPAWDLARAKLETYFDRNLSQVRAIFYVAVVVMVVGFGFVLWGIRLSVLDSGHVQIAVIASVSGIITQFIGLTFMALYRSTMIQANKFMAVLERINTVGMAVQILDSMDKDSPELKDATRVDIIRLLLATPKTSLTFPPRSRKGAKRRDGEPTLPRGA